MAVFGNRLRTAAVVMACLVVCAFISAAADAQTNPFRSSTVGLETSDVDMLMKAAESLYARGTPARRKRATWSNPQTGNKGVVVVSEVKTQPRLCVSMIHRYESRRLADQRTFTVQRCRAPSGTWELIM